MKALRILALAVLFLAVAALWVWILVGVPKPPAPKYPRCLPGQYWKFEGPGQWRCAPQIPGVTQ